MGKEQEQVPWGYARKHFLPSIWMHYKLTQQDYAQLWERQNGCCAGCKVAFAHPMQQEMRFGVKPEIDHRHVEGKRCEKEDVRGLLCRNCNGLLAKMRDSKGHLKSLLNYLTQHGDYYV